MNLTPNSIKGYEMTFDKKALGEDLVYMTSPHAPSVVTTISPNGSVNVGAFEQTMLCSDIPPMMILAITKSSVHTIT